MYAPSAPASRLEQALAFALYSGRFWPVSIALVAKAIGATIAGSFSRGSSFTTALALRTAVNRRDSVALRHRQSRLPSARSARELICFLPPSLPRPLAGTLEQRIDALITRHSESTHVSTEELRQAVMGSERELIGGGAGSSAMTDGIRISISCDMGDAPSPQRHISRGTGSRESDGSDSDASDTGSDIWGSGRTSVLLAPPARGTGSTFPSAAEYGRSGLVQERVHRQYDC